MKTKEAVERGDSDIHSVSALILRTGVVVSVSTMLLGLALRFAKGFPTVAEMQGQRYSGDLGAVLRGAVAGDGLSLIELGILLLVLTPILRVASSMVIFATEERDWFYALVTFLVLALTLVSLLVLK